MDSREEEKYQIHNSGSSQGQIIGEYQQINQYFYNSSDTPARSVPNTPYSASLHQSSRSTITVPPSPFLFLCSAPKDLPLVERLRNDLQTHGMTGWAGRKAYQPGSAHEQEHLREAIRHASAVILVASPHTRRSRLVRQELYIAEMYQRSVYLFWMQGDQLGEVMPASQSGLPFFDARGEHYAQALQDLLQATSKQVSPSSSQGLFSENSPHHLLKLLAILTRGYRHFALRMPKISLAEIL